MPRPQPDDQTGRSRTQLAQPSDATAIAYARQVAAARQLVATMEKTAQAFENTAVLAEYEAKRRAGEGRDDAAGEFQVAASAREAARRAHSHADAWRAYALDGGA